MKTSDNGIKLIKHFEGCRLIAYRCPAGKLTIGTGHTGLINGNEIKEAQTITRIQADQLLRNDLIIFEKGINQLVIAHISQNQFDALVSFAFNIGLSAFRKSTLLKLLNENKFNLATKEFSKYKYAGKKVLLGLVKRRNSEAILFSTGKLTF